MIPESKRMQFGLPGATIKGIVIHNTNSTKTAQELAEWMEKTGENKGCHYLVDDEEVIQVMPLTWSVYNSGKGMDFGNTSCVAIEICTFPSEAKSVLAERKAIDLIKHLMEMFDLTLKDIYFHRDLDSSVNCPAQILRRYGSKANFIERRLK